MTTSFIRGCQTDTQVGDSHALLVHIKGKRRYKVTHTVHPLTKIFLRVIKRNQIDAWFTRFIKASALSLRSL